MAAESFIIFQVSRDLFGLETGVVKEIIWVPELFWNHKLPKGLAGIFSYRGAVVPVLDLHQWVEGEPPKLSIHNQVIVVECAKRKMGLLVDKVREVTSLDFAQMDEDSSDGTGQGLTVNGVIGISHLGSQTVGLLDLSLALQDLQASFGADFDSLASEFLGGMGSGPTDKWIPLSSKSFNNLTQEDYDILQERANGLAQSESETSSRKWNTWAVVRLNDKYVGLDPDVVREFADLGDLVPIPCCPNFVLGNMNLRGEVLTVFDVRQVLNMSIEENRFLSQVVVIQFDTAVFGIAVEEVLDCMSCESESLSFRSGGEAASFLTMVSQYRGQELQYLDLSQIISKKMLEVYEEV